MQVTDKQIERITGVILEGIIAKVKRTPGVYGATSSVEIEIDYPTIRAILEEALPQPVSDEELQKWLLEKLAWVWSNSIIRGLTDNRWLADAATEIIDRLCKPMAETIAEIERPLREEIERLNVEVKHNRDKRMQCEIDYSNRGVEIERLMRELEEAKKPSGPTAIARPMAETIAEIERPLREEITRLTRELEAAKKP